MVDPDELPELTVNDPPDELPDEPPEEPPDELIDEPPEELPEEAPEEPPVEVPDDPTAEPLLEAPDELPDEPPVVNPLDEPLVVDFPAVWVVDVGLEVLDEELPVLLAVVEAVAAAPVILLPPDDVEGFEVPPTVVVFFCNLRFRSALLLSSLKLLLCRYRVRSLPPRCLLCHLCPIPMPKPVG